MKKTTEIKKKICIALIKSIGKSCNSDNCDMNKNIVCPIFKKHNVGNMMNCPRQVTDSQAYETAYKYYVRYWGEDKLIEELL